ncbi:MAG: hypothetical protein AAGH89_12695 [Verrucomicrobiota bacterium]
MSATTEELGLREILAGLIAQTEKYAPPSEDKTRLITEGEALLDYIADQEDHVGRQMSEDDIIRMTFIPHTH